MGSSKLPITLLLRMPKLAYLKSKAVDHSIPKKVMLSDDITHEAVLNKYIIFLLFFPTL